MVGRSITIKVYTPNMNHSSTTVHHETRVCFLEAAMTCFAKYGYDATSIRQISSMAGKNSSLISYYFKSKEGLYREVFKHLLTRFGVGSFDERGLDAAQAATDPEDGRPRLRALIRGLLMEVEAHFHSVDPLRDAAARLFLSEAHAPRDEVKDLIRERLEPSVREFRRCIHAIRPDLSAAEVDFWGISIQGCCVSHALRSEINRLVWTAADSHLPLDEMADRLTDFAYHGLKQS